MTWYTIVSRICGHGLIGPRSPVPSTRWYASGFLGLVNCLTDPRALRLIAWSCIAFHGSSGVLEAVAYAQGASAAILANVVARAVIVGLFAWLSGCP